jgi:hypothetical protein
MPNWAYQYQNMVWEFMDCYFGAQLAIILRPEQGLRLSTKLNSIAIHPLVYFPKLWNEFANPCKSTSSKILFKKELKKYFLDQLDANYKCNLLLCPHCHLSVT